MGVIGRCFAIGSLAHEHAPRKTAGIATLTMARFKAQISRCLTDAQILIARRVSGGRLALPRES